MTPNELANILEDITCFDDIDREWFDEAAKQLRRIEAADALKVAAEYFVHNRHDSICAKLLQGAIDKYAALESEATQ